MSSQQGVGLTELMISSFLACLLMTILLQHFLSCKRHYIKTQTLLEEEYELLLISEFLRDSSRRAGFTPCRSFKDLIILDRRDKPSELAVPVKIEKSSLTFARMNEDFAAVTEQIQPNQLLIEPFFSLHSNYPVIIADCYHAEIHEIMHLKKTPRGRVVTLKRPVSENFIPPYFLGEWLEERFFIEKNPQGIPALYYKTQQSEELTSLIQQLTAQLQKIKGKTLVQISLGLRTGKTVVIETMVRTP